MQYIQVDEWDLSSLSLEAIHDLRKENIPVCLQTEIVCGNEKVILMNIFAPRDQIFWNFTDKYRAFAWWPFCGKSLRIVSRSLCKSTITVEALY